MKLYSLFFILFISIFSGCDSSESKISKIHWDRDMCERCKMAVSDRHFAFEIINPDSNKAYKFDDIGCGILWLNEENISWKERAIFWITDAKSGRWIDAKKALYSDDSITPMAYGFAAYTSKTKPKGKDLKDFDYVKSMIFEIEKLNNKRVQTIGKD